MVICLYPTGNPVHPTRMGNTSKNGSGDRGRGYPICSNRGWCRGRVAYPPPRPVPGIYIYIVIFLNILYIIYKLLVNIYLGYIYVYMYILFVCKNYAYLLCFYIYRSKRNSKFGQLPGRVTGGTNRVTGLTGAGWVGPRTRRGLLFQTGAGAG